jgi:4-aminobutyrate aminotransferase-like enzyme
LILARKVGALITGDARSVRLVAAESGTLEDGPGVTIAVENESLGRRGTWFAIADGRVQPSLIVAGNVLAAGKDFGALFIERSLVSRVPVEAISGFSPPPNQTVALARAVIDAVETQQLVAKAKELGGYFRNRLEAVQASCNDIAEVQFAGLSARIRLNPNLSGAQLKRRLCERGLLVGVDDRGWILIRPPLAMRPAEIDVISGVLRGALLGTATARAPICCSACQNEPV